MPKVVAPTPPATTSTDSHQQAPVKHPATAPVKPQKAPQQPASADNLAGRIQAFISQPRFRHADWGIDVVELATGQVRYSHQAEKLFIPASNAKLYTAALALAQLGSKARFTTTLLTTAVARGSGMLNGDLILRGGGDPSLGNPGVAPGTTDWADQFATVLSKLGINRINGDLIGDDTYYRGSGYGSGWEADDLQTWYASRASSLTVGGNMMSVTVARSGTQCCSVKLDPDAVSAKLVNLTSNTSADNLAIYRPAGSNTIIVSGSLPGSRKSRRIAQSAPAPAMLATRLLQQALLRHGISLRGRIRVVRWPQMLKISPPARITVLARVHSPPLREIIRHMLKHSDNLYAQHLLQQVGVALARKSQCPDRQNPPVSSDQWGLCAMRALLKRTGIGQGEATFSEGSGLSRRNLVSPAATTSLLLWIQRQGFAADFRHALPIAGVDGTLQHRMTDSLANNNLQAKTGTLTHAYALAGYVTNPSGQQLAFALYLDRYQRPRDKLGRRISPSPQADLDAIAGMIAGDGASMSATEPTPASPQAH